VLRQWHSRLRASLGDESASVWLLRRQTNGRQSVVHTGEVRPSLAPTDIADVINALDLALQEASEAGNDLAGLRCDVVIADLWMVYDVIEAELEDTPRRAVDDLVSAALADTLGVKPGELVARWQRQGAARSLACALPAGVLQTLQAMLLKHRVRLGSVNGELVRAFNANRHGLAPARAVLAVARPAGTQLGLIVDGGFVALRFEPGIRDASPLLERSHALMRCAGFGPDPVTRYYADDTLPAAEGVPWAGRTPRQPWLRRLMSRGDIARLDLDLSPTRPRVPPASWLLLVAGALAAGFAALQFQTASAERAREAHALRTLETSLSEPAAGSGTPAAIQEARSARATVAALRELDVPWASLFVALESVAGRNVALLSIEPSAQRQEVRITAEAKNSAAMLDFLDALGAQSLREVVLLSHQVQAQTPGTPFRFQARAQWAAP
jgi:hypothetical protein